MNLLIPTSFRPAVMLKTDLQDILRGMADNNTLYVMQNSIYTKADSSKVTVTWPNDYTATLNYNGSDVSFAVPENGADIADFCCYKTANGYNNGTPGDGAIPYNSSENSIAYNKNSPNTADDGVTVYPLQITASSIGKFTPLVIYQVADYIARFHDPAAMNTMAYKSLSNQSEAVCLTYEFSGSTITIPANNWMGGAYTAGYFSHNCSWNRYTSLQEMSCFSTGSICGTANAKVSEYYRANSTLNYDNDPVGFFPDTALSDNLAISQGAGATFNETRYITNNVTIQNTFPSGYWVCVPQLAYYVPPNELTFSGTAASSQTVTITSYYTNTQSTGTARGLNFLYSYSNSAEVASYSGSLSTIKYSFYPDRLDCTESLSYTIGQFSTARTTTYTKSINAGAVDSYYLVEAGFTGSSASTYQSTAPAVYVSEGTESYSVIVTSTSNDRLAIRNYVINSLNNESYLNCTNWNISNDTSQRISWEEETLEWFASEGPRTISCSNIDYGLDTGWSAVWEIDYNGLADNYGTTYNAVSLYEYSTDIPDNPSVTYNSEDAQITLTHSYQFDTYHIWNNEYTLYYTYSNENALIPYSSSSSQTFRTVAQSDYIWISVNFYETVRYSLTATGSHGEYYTYNTNSLTTYPEATVIRSVTRV